MNYVFSLISLLVGIFFGVMIVTWLTVMPNYELSPSLIAYSAGTVIALCALGLTVFQANSTRRHQMLSVRPQLSLVNNIEASDSSISTKIVNNGIGPAIIKEFQVLLDGETVQLEGADMVFVLTEQMFNKHNPTLTIGHLEINNAIPANKEQQLFKAEFDITLADTLMGIWLTHKGRMKVIAKYESLYGEQFELIDYVDSK